MEIRPLTILAGANSSGKSSMMQPLLLLKQTLEASFDPGPLWLGGPNVKFTAADEFLSRTGKARRGQDFKVGIALGPGATITVSFATEGKNGLGIGRMSYLNEGQEGELRPGMSPGEIQRSIPRAVRLTAGVRLGRPDRAGVEWSVVGNRCFLEFQAKSRGTPYDSFSPFPLSSYSSVIQQCVHVPGLRGNPERVYQSIGTGPFFPGPFHPYVASVIEHWQEGKAATLPTLNDQLGQLDLTSRVAARRIAGTMLALEVGRLPAAAGGKQGDLVNIADVGFGVSQALPVLVALLAAEEGRMVYLEQPELHLHPRAQYIMAQILAQAAKRGVHVVAETHSSMLLLGLQTLVAEGKLPPDEVILHWFTRRPKDGVTEINTAELDERGAFGDWPEDFGQISLEAESAYLDAVESPRGSR